MRAPGFSLTVACALAACALSPACSRQRPSAGAAPAPKPPSADATRWPWCPTDKDSFTHIREAYGDGQHVYNELVFGDMTVDHMGRWLAVSRYDCVELHDARQPGRVSWALHVRYQDTLQFDATGEWLGMLRTEVSELNALDPERRDVDHVLRLTWIARATADRFGPVVVSTHRTHRDDGLLFPHVPFYAATLHPLAAPGSWRVVQGPGDSRGWQVDTHGGVRPWSAGVERDAGVGAGAGAGDGVPAVYVDARAGKVSVDGVVLRVPPEQVSRVEGPAYLRVAVSPDRTRVLVYSLARCWLFSLPDGRSLAQWAQPFVPGELYGRNPIVMLDATRFAQHVGFDGAAGIRVYAIRDGAAVRLAL